ncbi:PhzF family phenazine biosynthesis protein [Geothrix terrae]|uniref:PhzF family phenazine biosynthesis protein n=1 Tax=Geothrix terrae TaxID=2922720 RepID=UPI001FAD7F0F|nr:PhzF family phenazine biosynthesis protein [Geothrix terrae]
MRLPLHQIDAFASRPFEGNPAAVMPLDSWLPDALMQSIAAENNLSETAFLVKEATGWRIRWFTTVSEVDLCGHATLASAWLILHELEPEARSVSFHSRSGSLTVNCEGEELVLDFPSRPGRPAPELADAFAKALGVRPREVRLARDAMVVLDDEAAVREVRPDYEALRALPAMGTLITAPGQAYDFVSRCFFPGDGVPEDPVTGSAHCTLIPYWAERLGKTRLRAFQASLRGGELACELAGDRVRIGGRAVKVLEGHFLLH